MGYTEDMAQAGRLIRDYDGTWDGISGESVARMRAQIGRPAKVIATGGLAVLFDETTDIFDAVDTDLTLDGLAILAERARGK